MNFFKGVCAAGFLIFSQPIEALAQDQPTPEMQKAIEFFGQAGNPEGRWIEGETMVPHVEAASHFNAAMLYYPGTEELQDNEIRVSFMGSTYYPSQDQSGMSIYVELGNGDRFVLTWGLVHCGTTTASPFPLIRSITSLFPIFIWTM